MACIPMHYPAHTSYPSLKCDTLRSPFDPLQVTHDKKDFGNFQSFSPMASLFGTPSQDSMNEMDDANMMNIWMLNDSKDHDSMHSDTGSDDDEPKFNVAHRASTINSSLYHPPSPPTSPLETNVPFPIVSPDMAEYYAKFMKLSCNTFKDQAIDLESSESEKERHDVAHSHSKKRHACEICHKRFSRPSGLAAHIRKHTGEKPHACPVEGCQQRFAVLSNLRRHLKSIHA